MKHTLILAAALLTASPLALRAELPPVSAPAQAAPAAAPVTLRYKFTVGQVRRYQLSMDMNMLMNTGQTGAGFPMAMTMQMMMTQTVKSVRPADGAATIVAHIESLEMLQNGKAVPMPEAQQAKMRQDTTQVMLPTGRILSVDIPSMADSGMPGAGFGKGSFSTTALLPDGPVKAGDTWAGTASMSGVQVASSSKLIGVDQKNGAILATIQNTQNGMMNMAMTKGMPAAMKMHGPLIGEATQVFDAAAGAIQSVSGTSNADITMTFGKPPAGAAVPPGMPSAMKMQMQMKYTMERLADTPAAP